MKNYIGISNRLSSIADVGPGKLEKSYRFLEKD
jgi:hypothetical protein